MTECVDSTWRRGARELNRVGQCCYWYRICLWYLSTYGYERLGPASIVNSALRLLVL